MQYGDVLRNLRNSKGLSQKELTERLNINRSTYARYETSKTQPDFDTLAKLSDFYEVSIDYLLGRTENLKLINYNKNEEKQYPSWGDEKEFEEWLNDPEVYKFYKEFNESPEERREALLAVWEILKKQDKNSK